MKYLIGKDNAFLIKNLIPSYPLGIRRICPSDYYLQTFLKPTVELVVGNISRIVDDSIVTETYEGNPEKAQNETFQNRNRYKETVHQVDIIIIATGFDVRNSISNAFEIIGKGGKRLNEEWSNLTTSFIEKTKKISPNKSHAPAAYYGVSIPNFANFFMLSGPNSFPSTNSVIYVFEYQCNYIIDCMQVLSSNMQKNKTVSMSVKEEALYLLMKRYEKDFVGKVLNPNLAKNISGWFVGKEEKNWFSWPNSCWNYGTCLLEAGKQKNIQRNYMFK